MDSADRPGAVPSDAAREPALMPEIAAALDAHSGSLGERLRAIAAHSSARGRYTSLGLIHDGVGGRVLRAWDEDLQREVALKELAIELPPGADEEERQAHEERLARFIEEARVTSQLEHPGIVAVHELACDADGRLYYTMPLVRGALLSDVIARVHSADPKWTLARVVGLLASVCDAVAYAHARGVVHRDLKPDNVLVGSFGEAIVTDWGLARVLDNLRTVRSPRIVGTPAYMAPEAVDGVASPSADVYSLGAILYALLTGRTPHEATVLEALSKRTLPEILRSPPRGPDAFAPGVPPELVAIANRAMAADPAARFVTAADLGADLRAWLEGRVVSAYQSGLLPELVAWSRRNRGLARALFALCALLFGSVALAHVLESRRAIQVSAKERALHYEEYSATLRAAALGLRSGDAADALAQLERCDQKLRGWEWEHLRLETDESLTTLLPFDGDAITAFAYHPATNRVALGSRTGAVRLLAGERLDAATPALETHTDAVGALAFSPDGSRVASVGEDGRLLVHAAADGTSIGECEVGFLTARTLSYLPDGERVAVVGLRTPLVVLDTRDGTRADWSGTAMSLAATAVLGEPARLFAALGDGSLHAFDPGAATAGGEAQEPLALGADIRAFAAFGRRDVVAATFDGKLLVFDAADPRIPKAPLLFAEGPVSSVAAAPDGALLAVGSYRGAIELLAPNDQRGAARRLFGHREEVVGLAFLADGSLVSGALDGTLKRWSPGGLARSSIVTQATPAHVVAASDGSCFARVLKPLQTDDVGSEDVVLVLDGRDLRIRARFPTGYVDSQVAFADAGRALAISGAGSAAGELRLVAPDDGEERARWRAHAAPVVALSGDAAGARMASFASDGSVCVSSVPDGGVCFTRTALDAQAPRLVLSHDGTTLAVQDGPTTLRVFAVDDGRELQVERFEHPLSALTHSADGRVLFASDTGGTVWRLDPARARRKRFLAQIPLIGQALAVSPDGRRLARANREVGVQVFDTDPEREGVPLLTLFGHDTNVDQLVFSSDGASLVSAGNDGALFVWRARR